MKKIVSLFVAVLLMLSMGAFVTAQAEQADETANEVAVMSSKSGAEVRLMQLEKSIARNIAVGERVVNNILEKNPEADVSGMNNNLAELKVIKEEIQTMADNESLNASQMVEKFVTIKEEARSMSSEFRSMAQERLSEQEREQIREEARNSPDKEVEEIEEDVRQKIREHNAETVRDVLGNMGVENETLVNRVRNGEMNVGEAVSQVAKTFRGLGQEQKQQARAIMNTQRSQMNERAQEAVENARRNMGQKMRERSEQREQKVEEKLQQVRQRISENMPEFENNPGMQNNTADGQTGPADTPGGAPQ